METFRNLMQRSHGEWTSLRRYYYIKADKVVNLTSDLTVEFGEHPDGEFGMNLSWRTTPLDSDEVQSEGTMETYAKDGKLYRNVGYMSEEPTVCDIKMIDENCVEFLTDYGGVVFREEIRLLDDNTRLRQTVGWKGGDKFLVGQYWETRKTNL